jgi:hypothetical protein
VAHRQAHDHEGQHTERGPLEPAAAQLAPRMDACQRSHRTWRGVRARSSGLARRGRRLGDARGRRGRRARRSRRPPRPWLGRRRRRRGHPGRLPQGLLRRGRRLLGDRRRLLRRRLRSGSRSRCRSRWWSRSNALHRTQGGRLRCLARRRRQLVHRVVRRAVRRVRQIRLVLGHGQWPRLSSRSTTRATCSGSVPEPDPSTKSGLAGTS